MREENKTLLKSFILVGVIVILTISVTYAYFAPNISGNETVSTIAVGGAKISLKYTKNSNNVVAENILPGWSTLKRFTVETKNTSGQDLDYNINLVITSSNFYTSESNTNPYLTYKLNSCTSASDTVCNGSTNAVVETTLNVNSGTKLVKTVTATGNSTVYYGLTLSFPNKNYEQKQTGTDNKPLEFSGYVTIESTAGIKEEKEANEAKEPVAFSTDEWATIASAVKSGNTSVYHVGDTHQITIDGRNYTLRIANMSTPEECSTEGFSKTACGFVVEFADLYYGTDSTLCTAGDGTCMMNTAFTNVGGWPSAQLRTYLNSETNTNSIYNKLKSVIGDIIADTNVVSGHGDDEGPREDKNWESVDKLYLLSVGEVYANALTSNQYDTASYQVINDVGITTTRQLDYYAGKTPVTKDPLTTSINSFSSVNNGIKKLNGTAKFWWLRAATSTNDSGFRRVGITSNLSNYAANYSGGVAPAFRIG